MYSTTGHVASKWSIKFIEYWEIISEEDFRPKLAVIRTACKFIEQHPYGEIPKGAADAICKDCTKLRAPQQQYPGAGGSFVLTYRSDKFETVDLRVHPFSRTASDTVISFFYPGFLHCNSRADTPREHNQNIRKETLRRRQIQVDVGARRRKPPTTTNSPSIT